MSFLLAPPATASQLSPRSLSSATHVVYVDIAAEDPEFQRAPIATDGPTVLELTRGGVYLIGFASEPSADSGEGITLVGELDIPSVSLASMPLSEDADDDIYLGELTVSGDSFTSTMTLTEMENVTGTPAEILQSYGRADQTMTKFLNPDINQNGLWDNEDGLSWSFAADYLLSFDIDWWLTMDDGTQLPAPLSSLGHKMYFRAEGAPYPASSWSEISLVLPSDLNVTNNGAPMTEVPPDEFPGPPPANENTYNFDLVEGSYDQEPPYQGDYAVRVGANSYIMRRVQFAMPDADYAGIPFTIWQIYSNGYGEMHRAEVVWRQIKGGKVYDALSSDIQKFIRSAKLAFWSSSEEDTGDGVSFYVLAESNAFIYHVALKLDSPTQMSIWISDIMRTQPDPSGSPFATYSLVE